MQQPDPCSLNPQHARPPVTALGQQRRRVNGGVGGGIERGMGTPETPWWDQSIHFPQRLASRIALIRPSKTSDGGEEGAADKNVSEHGLTCSLI